MRVAGDHRFAAPRDIVWDCLLSPDALRASLPGCQRLEQLDDDTFDVTLRIGVGPLRGTYSATVRVVDRREPDSFRLEARSPGGRGGIQGEAFIQLFERANGRETDVRYRGEVRAKGGAGRAGLLVLGGAAKLLIAQFFRAMEQQVATRRQR